MTEGAEPAAAASPIGQGEAAQEQAQGVQQQRPTEIEGQQQAGESPQAAPAPGEGQAPLGVAAVVARRRPPAVVGEAAQEARWVGAGVRVAGPGPAQLRRGPMGTCVADAVREWGI